MKAAAAYFSMILLLIGFTAAKAHGGTQFERILGPWKFYPADHPDFKDPGYDDSKWSEVPDPRIPRNPIGVKWLRLSIPFQSDTGPLIFSLVDLQSAYEVWWDGHLLARNGKVGVDRVSEVPGTIHFSFLVDGSYTTKGMHLLGIRYSNFHDFSIDDYSIYPSLADQLSLGDGLHRFFIRLILNFGICLSAFLIGIALFTGGGMFKSYIYFSLIVLPSWLVFGFFGLMYAINLPSWFAGVKQLLYFFIYNGTYFFIGMFFIIYFRVPRRYFYFSLMILLLLTNIVTRWNGIISLYSWQYYVIQIMIHLLNLGLLVYGIFRKRPGSWIFLTAYLVFFLTLPLEISGLTFMKHVLIYDIAFFLFIFILFFTVTAQLRIQIRKQHNLEVRTMRLESEILKKAIQPHFLMNTLASLQSWSRRDPEKTALMIQAIAGEYRMINEIVSETLIPIGEELKLCRHHLELMGYRRDAKYELICDPPCDTEMIPPLIFHTLIENGLTHAMVPKENGTFWFSCFREPGKTRCSLKNNGSLLDTNLTYPAHAIKEGTGFKYIKARLEEAFPGRWNLHYGLKEGKWEVEIMIQKKGT